jgi:hypothetical protein
MAVENSKQLDSLAFHSVWNDVWRICDDAFASAEHATWPADSGLSFKQRHSIEEALSYKRGVLLRILRNAIP